MNVRMNLGGGGGGGYPRDIKGLKYMQNCQNCDINKGESDFSLTSCTKISLEIP